MERKCLDCGEMLDGRSDKKFCNDQCRINYHNQKNQSSNNYIRRVHLTLLKNRSILKHIYESGNTLTNNKKLSSSGFNFSFHTHLSEEKNRLILYVFEFGLYISSGDKIRIIKQSIDA